MSGPRLRFAPSPTGRLHLGHAYSALLNERIARDRGGTWLLRHEDIDPVRATPERIAAVEEDLAWLGLAWPRPARRQSQHMEIYRDAAAQLRAAGLLYSCFCSRGDIAAAVAIREAGEGRAWPRDPDGSPLYPGTCRALSPGDREARFGAGHPHAWRLAMAAAGRIGPVGWRRFDPADGRESPVAARPERWGDAVIVRKEVATSYHLACVVDDRHQGITHVVRGRDLEAATDLHVLLAAWLHIDTPCYHHHALLTDASGRKLAKSRESSSLSDLREQGVSAEAVRHRLGFA